MKNLVLILVFLVSATVSFGQISFYKQYSNNGYDYGEGIVQTEDSSYIITGQSSSFLDGPAQAFLLKVDSLGNYLWSWHYGGEESDGGKRVMYIENDGILVAGYTNSFGAGAYDFYLFKTDELGNELWSETYGSASWDRVTDAALTSDSGVVMIGQTLNTIDGESDILIVRTDKNGQEVWSQQIGGLGEDLANVIEVMDDSTFVVGGKTYVEDSLAFKSLLFRIQDNGTVLWMDTLGLNGSYEIKDISIETNRIATVGMLIKPIGDTANFEIKTFLDGSFDYEYAENNDGISYVSSLTPFGFTNDYLVAVSYDNVFSFGKIDLAFLKFYNQLYYAESCAGVNYIGNDVLGQLISTSDKGAIAVGSVTEVGNGGSNIFIIKIYPGLPFFNSNDDLSTNSFVAISEKESSLGIQIYPNPVSTFLNFDTENLSEIESVIIYDIQSRIIATYSSELDKTINIEGFENGTYYLALNFRNGKIGTSKFIVSH